MSGIVALIVGCPPVRGVALSWPAWSRAPLGGSGSRRDCSARSSGALLTRHRMSDQEVSRMVAARAGSTGRDRDGSAQAVGHDRGDDRRRDASSVGGRYATDEAGFAAMRDDVRPVRPDRVWAIEGCNGIGRHVAQRLLAAGEQVVDVPPKLSARARVFATGQGRKTDATDAHSIALVGTRMAGLRPVVGDAAARCAAGAGRPAPAARRGTHPEGLPAARPAAGADPRRGEEGPVRRPSQSPAGRGSVRGTWPARPAAASPPS